MLTETQIETFAALVDEEANIGISDSDVIETADTVADFVAKFGRPHEVTEGLLIWHGVHAAKGQRRKDVCVYDFGEVRAVCAL